MERQPRVVEPMEPREAAPEYTEPRGVAPDRMEPRAREARESEMEAKAMDRIFLQPIAAPSILGLFGFAGATFIVAANLAGWSGPLINQVFLAPFAFAYGGIAQFAAAMWSYKARDGLATAIHGTWGAFWIGYGILFAFVAAGLLAIPATGPFTALGYWFIPLAIATWAGAAAAWYMQKALFSVLFLLGLGSLLEAIGFNTGASGVIVAGGWVLVFSAIAAWWTATGLMLEPVIGRPLVPRPVLPLGKSRKEIAKPKIGSGAGEPGVKQGQ